MAERGKGEESDLREESLTSARASLEEVVVQLGQLANDLEVEVGAHHVAWHYRLENASVDPGEVRAVVVGAAEPVRGKAQGHWKSGRRPVQVAMDDVYYSDVRRAVGRGAPSALLGTSTRSLERNFEELRAVERAKYESSAEAPVMSDISSYEAIAIANQKYLVVGWLVVAAAMVAIVMVFAGATGWAAVPISIALVGGLFQVARRLHGAKDVPTTVSGRIRTRIDGGSATTREDSSTRSGKK
jgi:hypothetical protein